VSDHKEAQQNIAARTLAKLAADQARLVCLDAQFHGLSLALSGDSQTIGRDEQADLLVQDNQVSRQHARIENRDGAWVLEDLRSSNGVQVNGKKISISSLSDGDLVEFGALPFRFEKEVPPATVIVDADAALASISGNATMPAPDSGPAIPVVTARLTCLDSAFPGLSFVLGEGTVCIGRDAGVDMQVDHKKISRKHAQFSVIDGSWWVEDLASTNGVRLNGDLVKKALLQDGDVIHVGPVKFNFAVQISANIAKEIGAAKIAEDEAGTMLFDDVRASEVLIKAMEEEQAQAQNSEPLPSPMEVASAGSAVASVRSPETPPERNLGGGMRISLRPITVVGIVVGAVLVVTLYFMTAGQREREAEILQTIGQVQSLVSTIEEENSGYDQQQSQSQVERIRNLSAQVNLVSSRYPQDSRLAVARSQLLFLDFERDLDTMMKTGMLQEAIDLVMETRAQLDRYTENTELTAADTRVYTDVIDLVELGGVMARLSAFAQRFPDPVAGNQRAPTTFDLKEAQQFKRDFIEKKKQSHLAISVTYPYFQRIVEKVDENSLRIINRWDELSRREPTIP